MGTSSAMCVDAAVNSGKAIVEAMKKTSRRATEGKATPSIGQKQARKTTNSVVAAETGVPQHMEAPAAAETKKSGRTTKVVATKSKVSKSVDVPVVADKGATIKA